MVLFRHCYYVVNVRCNLSVMSLVSTYCGKQNLYAHTHNGFADHFPVNLMHPMIIVLSSTIACGD